MTRALILAALLTAIPATAAARSFRVEQVPHGPQFDCLVCHLPAGGLNDFGFDAFLYLDDPRGDLDWSELYALDSDRDGYTNGEELGDPSGTWRRGDPAPPGEFSHPGDRSDGLCGNGMIDGDEDCEGAANGVSCETLDLGPGDVGCGADCRYDTSQCDSCGDGIRQMGEECDGEDLGGTTCMYLGLGTGKPACNGCRFDTSTCQPSEVCGDGQKSGTELCDGTNLGTQTCATLGYDGGILACRTYCTYDTTGCNGDVADVSVVDASSGKPIPDPEDETMEPFGFPSDDGIDGSGTTGCNCASAAAPALPADNMMWLVFGALVVSARCRFRRGASKLRVR